MPADPLDNWTTNRLSTIPNPNGGLLEAVTYGGGQYVAVGQVVDDDNGFIETSPDGRSWTLRSTNDYSILDLYDVTYGNNLFVAVGWDYYTGHNIYTSPDGINWTAHTTAMANVYGVAYGDGMYVAVGDGLELNGTITSNDVYYSTDGTNWTGSDSGATAILRDVAFGNGQFVAVDAAGYIYPLFTAPRIANGQARGKVSFCNGLFFISAGAGTNLLSTDGLSWSAVTNNTGASFGDVIYAADTYFALGGTNVFSSSDGTNWIRHNLQAPANTYIIDLATGGRNVVVGGYMAVTFTPYTPIALVSDPFVALQPSSTFPPRLTLSGLAGRKYQIEMATNLSPANWQPLINITLTNGPVVWTDLDATNSCRFYRAALLP
ncbi:MAG TPA: hypothetical protein VN873_03020 [Candidatus Angelobacter sp.]|nr:hypothetical protein [Candidatus Angelobacter sp.]